MTVKAVMTTKTTILFHTIDIINLNIFFFNIYFFFLPRIRFSIIKSSILSENFSHPTLWVRLLGKRYRRLFIAIGISLCVLPMAHLFSSRDASKIIFPPITPNPEISAFRNWSYHFWLNFVAPPWQLMKFIGYFEIETFLILFWMKRFWI